MRMITKIRKDWFGFLNSFYDIRDPPNFLFVGNVGIVPVWMVKSGNYHSDGQLLLLINTFAM